MKTENPEGTAQVDFVTFIVPSQPSLRAFSARSILDSTVSCDVTERYLLALSQTSRGQRVKRERPGTRLVQSYFVDLLRYAVTFCGAVVLKVMDQKTLVKRR